MIELCTKFKIPISHVVVFNDDTDEKTEKKIKKILSCQQIDLIMCNYAFPYIINLNLSIIILERIDSCTCTKTTSIALQSHNVLGVFKEYICTDLKNYQKPHIRNRLHYTNLSKHYDTILKPTFYYVPKELNYKIMPVSWNLYQYSFVCNNAMGNAKRQLPEKDIDIFFVCHPHGEHDLLYKHRTCGQTIIAESKKLAQYNIVTAPIKNTKEYREAVRRSKICICPYGLGSRIALDQLSILSGAIAVKPDMKHVTTKPDIYADTFFEYVDDKWSNLEDVVHNIMKNWESTYKQEALNRRERAIKLYTEEYYANEYAKAIMHTVMTNDKIVKTR
jgi:hypothetical protein